MADFKGFKQVSLAAYNGLTDQEKKHYLWLVRDMSGETVVSSAIYFGTRKYAEVNDSSSVDAKVERLISGLTSIVDENGDFAGFMREGHELLSSATTLTELFEILENAVLANADAISEKADAEEVQNKLDELEEKIEAASSAIESGITQDIEDVKEDVGKLESDLADTNTVVATKAGKEEVEQVEAKVEALETIASALTEEIETKADKDDVYTKDEIDAKIVGLFHFVDNADSVSADFSTISYNGEDIPASQDNVGDVYQVGDKEYASNGEKWVELGFNVDLSSYATKAEVEESLAEVESGLTTTQEALAKEIEDREQLAEKVDEVKNAATTTAATFADAEEMDLQLGQIIYVTNETSNSGITYLPGAYIKTQDGIKKLDSTTPSTSTTLDERVESLENRTGANQSAIEDLTELIGNEGFDGESVTAAIAALQETTVIDGDDVEE